MSTNTDPDDLLMMAATASDLLERERLADRMGEQFGGTRDLFDALGYQETFKYDDYRAWYDRGDIAQSIIEKPPSTTWSEPPEVIDDADVGEESETDFESDVESLFNANIVGDVELDRGLLHYLQRVDTLARIGRYGVLFLGLADADSEGDLADPVDTSALSGLDDLLYLTPLSEGDADITSWVRDVTSPRNGFPETYRLDLANGDRTRTATVHHTRVIHVAEGILDDEVYGTPALEPVMNRLFDIQKVLGSAAEAFWMVSNPGLALSVDPEFSDIPTEQMDEQIEEYEHDLRRVLKLFGADIEQLDAQEVDPSNTVEAELKAISGTVNIPQRKLVGSERGELASSQDEANYLEFIGDRQTSTAEPVILRRFFDRLIEYGIVSPPRAGTYSVDWPNLFQLNELELAQVKKTEAQAIKANSPMGDPSALHSMEALREWSPIDEPEDATPPGDQPDIDEEIDEEDPEVIDQFERMTDGVEADD